MTTFTENELTQFWADHDEVLAYWREESSRGVWEDSRDHFRDWIADRGYTDDDLAAVRAAFFG